MVARRQTQILGISGVAGSSWLDRSMPAIILRIVHGLFLDAFDIPENIFFRDSELLMFRDFCWVRIYTILNGIRLNELLLYRLYYSFKEEIER